MQCDHSCVTSGQASIENNREGITCGNHHTASSIECKREGVTGTGGYRHTASPQRVTSDQQWNVEEDCPTLGGRRRLRGLSCRYTVRCNRADIAVSVSSYNDIELRALPGLTHATSHSD